ncbi:MAG: hypothetical protein QGF38_02460 [Rhodospirillales bacterium]|jgi:hypothetical protein|nr:hypothetical protein [Rhodospirillales bacterium]
MKLNEQADKAAQDVFKVLGTTPDEKQVKYVAAAIEKAVIGAVPDVASRCATVAKASCSAEKSMANKIEREVRRTNELLIANLSSMR